MSFPLCNIRFAVVVPQLDRTKLKRFHMEVEQSDYGGVDVDRDRYYSSKNLQKLLLTESLQKQMGHTALHPFQARIKKNISLLDEDQQLKYGVNTAG